jgi:hypothetical protein
MAIELDPVRGVHSARRLADSAARITHARNTVGGEIEAAHETKPWGDDELGTAFAATYADAASRVLDAWRQAARRTVQLGEDIETAVDTMVGTDEAAAERIAQAGGLNPS